ncbi:LysR family transcriptional regulator [Ampullimonas aquatilis]|uniref:LysR family transcriptional regulator n=1 Tax=Ampullimonas aquatilis TaxID=1341549 RepID=UPI003C761C25
MNFQTLDLNLLRVFDVVMSELSLTRAADRLAMTQPAASNALRRLREAIGEDLFIRTAHGVRPTLRAIQMWPSVRDALSKLQQTLAPEVFQPEEVSNSFRLAMADITAATLLPTLAQQIESHHWKVNIRVQPLLTRDPQALLAQGEVDAAIGFFPQLTGARVAGNPQALSIGHSRLYSDSYVCLMRTDHPLANQTLTLDDYCAAEHVLINFSGGGRGFVDEALNNLGRSRRVMLSVNQFNTAARIAAKTNLLTLAPGYMVNRPEAMVGLIAKPFPFELPEVVVDMVWHERDTQRPSHIFLREQLHFAASTMKLVQNANKASID